MPGTRKLGRPTDHRRAMLRAMVTYLLENGKIETTVTRAKEVAPLAEIRPSCSRTIRLARTAMELSWVISTTVSPSAFSCCRKASTSRPVRESNAPVGSSARMTDGFPASARAMDTRCC